MNVRQTISNNEWNRQKTNIPLAQYPPNIASTYNMRPPYRSLEKFSDEHHTTSNKTESSTYNVQFNQPSAMQTSSATVNFTPNQNAIYSPRLTHRASVASYQITSNAHISQDLHGIRHQSHATIGSYPTLNQFAKIPCNLASVRSFQKNNETNASISNVNNGPPHMQSSNQNNISGRLGAYRNPPPNHYEMISSQNSSNKNLMRQPPPSVSNRSEFMKQPPPPNSNTSNSFRQPSLVPSMPGFIRPSLPQGFSKPDTLRQTLQPGFSKPDTLRQTLQPGFSNADFMSQVPVPDSSSSDFKPQQSSLGSDNPDFMRQPSLLGSNNPNFVVQSLPPVSIMQPPPNLSLSNVYDSSAHIPYSMQMPPPHPTGGAPSATLKQDSCFNLYYGPNLSMPPPPVNVNCVEENKLSKFMERFTQNKKSVIKTDLTVSEFRNKLKNAFVTVRKLMEFKANLVNLLDADENDWNGKLKEALHYRDQLTRECDFLSDPKILNWIQSRLQRRKRKRELRKKIRLNRMKENTKKVTDREELHHTLDKWLESIQEKNLKLEREAEMKKEADSILAEVRRKIHEAKRTIDKIKVFEKLRSARHANAVKKGLFLPEHDKRFQIRISELKSTLFTQLSDYESEEKALKVMLEAEQEGQLEEEAMWRIKKLKTSQQRRQKNIMESLFGNEDEPTEENPIFLFHQYHYSGNKTIENLVQIRHHWDLHLNNDGEAVPSQWVVPLPPSSAAWEVALNN